MLKAVHRSRLSPDVLGWFSAAVIPLAAGIVVGVLAGTAPLMITATICGGLLVLLITIARPETALCFYFCGIIMMTDGLSFGDYEYFVIPDADIITGLPSMLTTFFLLVFCVTAAQQILVKREPIPVSLKHLCTYLVILLVSAVAGFLLGGNPELIYFDFMKMLLPVLCFYLCMTLFNSREFIFRLIMLLLAVAAIKALILSAFYLAGRGWLYQLDGADAYRITTMDSADLLAFITLPLIIAHLIVRKDLTGFKAFATATACLPMLFVVVFSYRRAQWVGLVFSVGLLYLGASKTIRQKMGLFVIALLVAACAFAVTVGLDREKAERIAVRITSIFDTKHSSNVYHVLESRQVLKDIAESPFFGLGLGSSHSPIGLGMDQSGSVPTNVVHNTFLYIWMKLGLPGLFFFTWASWIYARRILRFRQHYADTESWGIVLPLAASCGLWFAMFLTAPVPWYLHQTSLIALFAAMAMAWINLEPDPEVIA